MKKLAHLAHQEPVLDIPNCEHSITHNYDSGSTVVVYQNAASQYGNSICSELQDKSNVKKEAHGKTASFVIVHDRNPYRRLHTRCRKS
jgi:hypothetical protein